MSGSELTAIFSKNLNYYLSLSKKSQAEVAKKLGISVSTFSSWCTGQRMPRMDKIQMLANYFGIEKSDLIEEKLESNNQKSIPNDGLNDTYFSLAKSAQDEGIDPRDIKLAIETIKAMKKQKGED